MRFWLAAFIFLCVNNSAAFAQGCVDYDIYDAGKTYPGARFIVNYLADIQEQDLYNSKGVGLSNAEQILRQDRANVHKFKTGSEMDSHDSFFGKPANRALLETGQLVTYCNINLTALKRQISQGRVPGLLDVMVFKMLGTGRYTVFINVVG
ncbi:hypothetical protein OEG84_23620 [Hoeflea sp. G2-23]|uniref:Uncharacterized protein n=1 Tax=Hoeflea algicola TaxID=2983763 RepID=A0ABT3ZC03_9HYPH|nr:hypothetical protein [Hoeflea algicola]MCY0149305.1 hypothetical protein [Hoeflea algicola]MCY0150610.1 hypothetical protein [Hoeflea algicola]